ncbi:MAG: hypothetical protein Ct9H300mP11_24340 [Chloroflexota bacterium]|nr:MAG: hypothetical protein Ct9H300mP11_24340 [Chloroflexota bacterium]
MTWDRWHDWDEQSSMEQIPLDYKPGKVIAYHPRNFGWVVESWCIESMEGQ